MSMHRCLGLVCVALSACNALSGVVDLNVEPGGAHAAGPGVPAPTVSGTATSSPDASVPPLGDAANDSTPAGDAAGAADAAPDAVVDASTDGPPLDAKRVFVTSLTTNAAVGGFNGADTFCSARAAAANLGGTWVAWLSAGKGGVNALERLPFGTGPWYLVTGELVAPTRASLGSGSLSHAIDRDEAGQLVAGAQVWTGTGPSGRYQSRSCKAWSVTNMQGRYGTTSGTDATWTSVGSDACGALRRLYCFEK